MSSIENVKYRWIVLVVACVVNALTWGMTYSVGILYSDWVRYFDSSPASISFVGGLPTAMGCLAGPIYGYMVGKLDLRLSGFLGGLLALIGMLVTSLVSSVNHLLIAFGIVTGFGVGLANFAASGGINEFFLYDRAFAEGIVGGGVSAGMFLFSSIFQILRNEYTWRGSVLISGAICANICLCSLFFIRSKDISHHPLNPWRQHETTSKKQLKENKHTADIITEANSNVVALPGFFHRSWDLWRCPLFLLILVVDFLSWIATFVPYVHLIERARQSGVDANTASWLSSACGIAGLIGRPLTGFVCTRFKFHPFYFYSLTQLVVGVSTVLSPHWNDINGFFALAIVVGFFSNTYGLIKASTAHMLGLERFIDALSWLMLFEGIGISIGPVFAGLIFDATNSYDWSFRFSGSLLILSSLLCSLKRPVKRLSEQIDAKHIKVHEEVAL